MSKLIIFNQSTGDTRECPLDRERIKIGRRTENDIVLEHISVSGEHALITTIRNDSFLQDLGSTNGVRVNGKLVKNHHLQTDDEITIAIFSLKYVYEAWVLPEQSWLDATTKRFTDSDLAAHSSATLMEMGDMEMGDSEEDFNLTREMSGNRMFDSEVTMREAPAESSAGRHGVLRLMGGPGAGRQLELTKPVLTLGKPGIQTAVIGKKSVGFFLTYVEGSSYPLVNGVEVGATPYPLHDHDILEVAGTRLEFFYK